MSNHNTTRTDDLLVGLSIAALPIIVLFMGGRALRRVRRVMAIGGEQAAIRAVIASALAEHASENARSVDALEMMAGHRFLTVRANPFPWDHQRDTLRDAEAGVHRGAGGRGDVAIAGRGTAERGSGRRLPEPGSSCFDYE
jgi:hypothetical protein